MRGMEHAMVVLLALLILAIFLASGFALFSGLARSVKDFPERLLLAPAVGIALLTVLATLISRLGVPLGGVSTYAVACVVAVALAVVYQQRHLVASLRPVWPLVGVGGGLIALAVPGVLTGSTWFGYANGDAAYYLFGATRLLDFGFAMPGPEVTERLFESGLDYTSATYFSQVDGGARSGAETLLAFISGTIRVSPLHAYMPLMLAVAVSLGMASMAIARRLTDSGPILLFVGFVVTAGAQGMYAVHNQLLAQMLGLTLAASIIALVQLLVPVDAQLLQHIPPRAGASNQGSPSTAVGRLRVLGGADAAWVLTTSLAACGLALTYPEVAPFVALALLLQGGVLLVRRRIGAIRYWSRLGVAVVSTALMLGLLGSLVTSVRFLASEAVAGQSRGTSGDSTLFPDYLVSTGPSAFWGFNPFFAPFQSVWVNIALLVVSVGLLISLAAVMGQWGLRGLTTAWLGLLMLSALAYFVVRGSGFPAFKLAMWIQPFVWPVVGVAIAHVHWRRVKVGLTCTMLALILAQVATMDVYTSRAVAGTAGPLNQAPQLTPAALASIESGLERAKASGSTVVFEDDNSFMRQLVALLGKGQSVRFGAYSSPYPGSTDSPTFETARFGPHEVSFGSGAVETFADEGSAHLVLRVPSLSVVNASQADVVSLEPPGKGVPRLTFIPSTAGGTPDQQLDSASFTSPERDPIWGGSLQAFRRFALFRIDNYQPGLRIHASVTGTFSRQHSFALHPISVWGAGVTRLDFVGAGSGRLTSVRPINPLWIQGMPFVLIDFGVEPAGLSQENSPIPRLWNPETLLDSRKVSTYVRDLSLKTEDEYIRETAAASETVTVETLRGGRLTYSGLFEDGWASDQWIMNLNAPEWPQSVQIRGVVASNLPPGELRYGCENQPSNQVPLAAGEPIILTLRLELPACQLRVTFEPSASQAVPSERILFLEALSWSSEP